MLEPQVSVDDLSDGKTTEVALDAGFVDARAELGLEPGVVGSGDLVDGSLVFPITGGNVTVFEPGTVPNYVIGQIQHQGSGFSLSAGGTKVDIGNFVIDPEVSRVYGDVNVNGKRAAESAVIFDLNGNTLQDLQVGGGEAVLEGSEVTLSETAAELLGQTFKTEDVSAGLLIGVATITVRLP